MIVEKDLCLILVSVSFCACFLGYYGLKLKIKQQRDTFIKLLGHDFKVLVIAQLRALELILSKKNCPQDLFIKEINESCKTAYSLVSMLEEIYRAENKDLLLFYEKFNLSNEIKDLIVSFSDILSEKSIRIICKAGNIEINADKNHILKVVNLILKTALVYADSGTELTISLSENNNFNFEIKYSGRSFSKDEISGIFSLVPRFAVVGHGIEMYYCKKIIDFYKGRINLKSEKNGQNSFSFSLPKYYISKFPYSIKSAMFRKENVLLELNKI